MRSRILLADDSITIQKVVNLTFADEGIDVVAVSNGEMAEKKLSDVNPDLVLADIFMPGKNGYELCDTIKKNPQFRNVPVLLLVGAFEPFDQLEAKRVKADGHLTKPFESRTLVETVRKLIQSASSRPSTGSLPSAPPQPEAPEAPDPLDTNPISTPPPTLETAAPEFPIEVALPLSETSPLDLDYSVSAPLQTEDVESVFPEAETEPAPAFRNGFVRTTGALSSVGPGAVHNASDNGKAEILTESYGDSSLSDAVPPRFAPPTAPAMPSPFGDHAGELVVDFEASVEPPPSNSSPVATEATAPGETADAGHPFLVETPVVEAQTVEPVVAGAPASTPVMEPPIETEFVAIDAPLEVLPDSTSDEQNAGVLAVDEPLGDVLSDAAPMTAAESGPAIEVAPPMIDQRDTPTAELPNLAEASPHSVTEESFSISEEETTETVIESVPPAPALDVLMPPPVVPSALKTGNAGDGDKPATCEPPLSYTVQPEPVASFNSFEVTSQSEGEPVVSAPQGFTTSPRWAEPTDAQPPIDIEATAVEEIEGVVVQPQNGGESEGEAPITVTSSEPTTASFEASEAQAPEAAVTFDAISDAANAATLIEQSAVEVESRTDSVFPDHIMTDLPPTASDANPSAMSQSMIDEIVRRVLAELSESVVREIAWEVVPDCVERVVGQMTRDGVAKRV